MYDVLIVNGRIISGKGNPWFQGDLAVVKGKIVKIGRLANEQARKIIDAAGFVVCPGFIDGHSHSDLHIFVDPRAEQKVLQGVTTENLGMDGMSVAPIDEENIADWRNSPIKADFGFFQTYSGRNLSMANRDIPLRFLPRIDQDGVYFENRCGREGKSPDMRFHIMKIPKNGMSKDELFHRLEEFRSKDLDWRSGHVFGYVYDPGPEVREVGSQAYSMFLTENGLDFTVFPSLLRLENDLVAMAAKHLGGNEDVVGNFTSGGTESIILAVKAARDYSRAHRPDIHEPEMILPTTAHAAFHKAAHYLQIKVVQVGVDPKTFRADANLVAKAITPSTILLVGSAPSYAHGVVDPIRDLGALALKHDLLLHVDACVGGFMLPYFRRLGAPIPDFDFRVPGVTSMSMDLHKYAYTPKGASLVLYRDKELRKFQIFASSRWTGYTLINNAVQSSKSGGPMAAAWAVLNFVGDNGYLEFARRKLEATRRIVEGIEAMKDLQVMTKPDMCLLAFTSDTVNVFHIIDEMNRRGWHVQPALTFANSKENVHVSINVSNVEWVDDFLDDLKASVQEAKTLKSSELATALGEGSFSIDLSQLSAENFMQILEMVGIQGTELPERMAGVNEALNVLSPEIRERLLIEFVNELFRYRRKKTS